MKTLEQVLESFCSNCIDGRDASRLSQFVKEDDLHKIGIKMKDEFVGQHETVPYTRENILKQLEKDVKFGYEKATNMRGISSSLMFEVVRFWNWILEEGLEDYDTYGSYGMPLFQATAKKYGFELE